MLEIITAIWMLTVFLDEIRQFIRSGLTFKTRLHYYFSDRWNKLDISVFSIFAAAIVVRTLAAFLDPAYEQWKTGNFHNLPDIYGACTKDGVTEGLTHVFKVWGKLEFHGL